MLCIIGLSPHQSHQHESKACVRWWPAERSIAMLQLLTLMFTSPCSHALELVALHCYILCIFQISPSTQTLLLPITSVRSLPCSSRRCFALWWPCGTTWQHGKDSNSGIAAVHLLLFTQLPALQLSRIKQSSFQTLGDDLEDLQSVNTSLLPIYPANLEVSVALLCCLTCESWCRYEALAATRRQRTLCLPDVYVCMSAIILNNPQYLQHKNFNKLIQQTDWIETTEWPSGLPASDMPSC